MYCGKEFYVIPAKANRARYCSKECRIKASVPIMTMKFRENLRKSRKLMQYYVSIGQMILYKYIKNFFPSAKLEVPIDLGDTIYFGDIVIPELKIDIEYDGCDYFHRKRKDRDEKRDNKLKLKGWNVIRIKKDDLKNMNSIIHKIQHYYSSSNVDF
jgi:very-short-patch-repair endonuclease